MYAEFCTFSPATEGFEVRSIHAIALDDVHCSSPTKFGRIMSMRARRRATQSFGIQSEAVNKGDRVIVDDVIESGGSALAAVKLIERAGGQCAGNVCLVAFPNWGSSCYLTAGSWHAIASW
jgi:orotate phosphoribosyltransferase